MFFAPVFFVMAIVNGAIQVLNIGPVVDAGCAHADFIRAVLEWKTFGLPRQA